MEELNWLDIVLAVTIILSALVGISRGLIKEILSILAWIIAAYVAWRFSPQVSQEYIQQFISDARISYLAAFGVLFLLSLFAMGLLNMVIGEIFSATGISGFDRVLGALFGLLRGVVICTVLIALINYTPFKNEQWLRASKLAPGFSNLATRGKDLLPESVWNFFNEISQAVNDGDESQKDNFKLDEKLNDSENESDNNRQDNAQSINKVQLESIDYIEEAQVAARPRIDASDQRKQTQLGNSMAQMSENNSIIQLESIDVAQNEQLDQDEQLESLQSLESIEQSLQPVRIIASDDVQQSAQPDDNANDVGNNSSIYWSNNDQTPSANSYSQHVELESVR